MTALSKAERETCILVDDNGIATIWSCSRRFRARLIERLGPPHRTQAESLFWDKLDAKNLAWLPRQKRRKSPKPPQ